MTATVEFEVEGPLARVRLNRPARHNAVSLAMFGELAAIGDKITANSSIRAVVLCAAGEHFCAGIDTELFGSAHDELTQLMEPQAPSLANVFQRAAYVWREVPVPVICAINGVAFGAGLQIALGADLRYAAPTAQLSIMEIKWGLIPDMAISVLGRGLVPLDQLRELAYTGRVIAAAEAAQLGLLTGVCSEPERRAEELAAAIAQRSPDAVRAAKALFNGAWDQAPGDALATEARLQRQLLGRPNQQEAARANLSKRQPAFDD